MAQLMSANSLHNPSAVCLRALTCLLLAILLGLIRTGAQAAALSDVERQVKAAYLYKFAGYVEWPERTFASAGSPLQIGVIGANALADELAQLAIGRTANGRSVNIRKLRSEDPLSGLNVLFIGRSNPGRLAEIVAAIKGQSMLIVTETDEALALGSMINFVVVDGKVRFEVAPRAAGQSKLSISARLLAAAYKVAPGPRDTSQTTDDTERIAGGCNVDGSCDIDRHQLPNTVKIS
jgi:hypothetical protein